MADLARGERIKTLREDRHLTQPAVADEIGVTLRAYQSWEAHGALRWENAKKLARFFKVDEQWLWSGDREKPETPDLMGQVNGTDTERELRAEVQELKDMLNDIARAIEGLSTQLEATSEQSAARFESLRAELAKRARRAA